MEDKQVVRAYFNELATEVLETFDGIARVARETLDHGNSLGPDSLVNVNTMTSAPTVANINRINREKQNSCETLLREPAIARVKTTGDAGEKTYYICRTTPMGAGNLASYRSPIGRLASLPVGEEFRLPNGTMVEVAEQAQLRPTHKGQVWDAVDTIIRGDRVGQVTIESLRALLSGIPLKEAEEDLLAQLLAGESESANIRAGVRRSVIAKMGLRDQPILDKYQDEIFRLPLDNRLLILGPPGTGKTTTLIRRLGQKLDLEFLDDEERRIVERATQGNGVTHADSWLMFTPTELLKQYLKEAFACEGVPASDQRIRTWSDYRRELARNTFGMLRTAAGGGLFVLKEHLESITSDAVEDSTDWFTDFYDWQRGSFIEELRQAASTLSIHEDTQVSTLGKRLQAIIERASGSSVGGVLTELVAAAGDARELRKGMKDRTDKVIRGALNLQLNRNKGFVDELAKFIETLQADPDIESEDTDEQELDEEEADVTITGRMKAINAYMQAVRSKARARAKKRSIGKKSRNSQIVEWLGDRMPSPAELDEIGASLVVQDNLGQFVNPIRRYLGRIPNRYRAFRRVRQKDDRWYQADGFATSELHPLELDVVLLGVLRAGGELLSRPNITRDINNDSWAPLRPIIDLHRHQILVDEATDFSPIQIGCMAALSNPQLHSFFACGDFNQRMTVWGARSLDQMKWVFPKLDVREITVSYRQSRQLNELARAIIETAGGRSQEVTLPDQTDNEGVAPALLENGLKRADMIAWLAERIREIERFVGQLPSIAVFVESEADVQPLADELNAALEEENAQVVACPKGQVMGQDNDVRVFDVQHIKGLEFEAVFFIGIDRLAERHPDLFDKYLYVGTTRAATYLGLTCQEGLPPVIETLRSRFVHDWASV